MREDLKQFMEDHHIEKATLIGHSMGGKTVMSFAMKYPECVDALIVVDIAPKAYHDLAVSSHAAANHSKMIDSMLDLDFSRMQSREEVSNALAVNIGSDRIRMFLLKNLTRNEQKEFCWKINLPVLKKFLPEIMDAIPIEEAIANGGIKGFPVCFIRGEKSDYILPEDHDKIRRLFPTAEILSIPNSGHWVHAEQPELLVKNLQYFLG
jgi:pimeloyl-ACP methyl ester carboxylesterase